MLHDVLFGLGLFLILATLIPLIRHDFWIFRVFEYPRLQKLVINLLVLLCFCFLFMDGTIWDIALLAALSANLIYLIYLVIPFTKLGRKQIVGVTNPDESQRLRLFIANVFQDNRNDTAYHKLIEECDPDVILMVETNGWWAKQMNPLLKRYPHHLSMPLENTYGMLLYSRLNIVDGSVKFLVKEDIPSIEATVILPSGQPVQLFCLHPEPPVPQENPRSTERDKEILMVGTKAKEMSGPVVVMGDLNDVAWSYTTELFGKVSGLLDPRRGRGFFNSFNAKYFFLRFPLDHIFCSQDFALGGISRLNSCGSDHFPMCVELQYSPAAVAVNENPEADTADLALAQEKIEKEVVD